MINKAFIDFAVKLLLKDKTHHIFSAFIFIFIVFILSSVVFVSDSLKYDMSTVIKNQPQIIVENQKEGRHTQITDETIDNLLMINGISNVEGRIDGFYHFIQGNKDFRIIGVDDVSNDKMQLGTGIINILKQNYYKDYFNFLLPNTQTLKLNYEKILPNDTNIISNDLIMVNTNNAKTILGLDDNQYSYLIVSVPNDSEIDYIAQEIQEYYPNFKVITKQQQLSNLEHLFYYKGGIFMILYVVTLISYFILLYKQVSSISGDEKKEIAILRSIGFCINDIIKLKFIQNTFVSISSYIFAVILAYIFVFYFGAPLLKDIFLGTNISNNITFTPIFNFDILSLIFLFTVIPFLASILIPSWKVAVGSISEALK